MDNDELHDIVTKLAEAILADGLSDKLRDNAKDASAKIGTDDFGELKRLFHNPPPEPEIYDVRKHGLGGWLSACQFAAFELIFHVGEPALPFIREIAWGPYDWTQGNAIELMIRFAAMGIKTDEIVKEIKWNFPDIRYEAQLYAIEPLLPRLKSDDGLRSVFDRLKHCYAFDTVYTELTDRSPS